jgi:hypothetical protein
MSSVISGAITAAMSIMSMSESGASEAEQCNDDKQDAQFLLHKNHLRVQMRYAAKNTPHGRTAHSGKYEYEI